MLLQTHETNIIKTVYMLFDTTKKIILIYMYIYLSKSSQLYIFQLLAMSETADLHYLLLGMGLMEIVTKPDFETGEQAEAFVREIQSTLRLINTCDGKMERK